MEKNRLMKAAVFTGIEAFQVREVPVAATEDDGILVKVCACGICGSDIRNYHTGLRYGITEQIMGHEISGIVEEAGKNVKKFKVGDRVAIAPDVSCGECYYCRRGLVNLCLNHKMVGTNWAGGFAQYIYLPKVVLEHGMVHILPKNLDFYEATLSEPASSVIAAQENNNVSLGDTVVVIGDGPIGCLHLEVARARGAKTLIMVGLTRLKEAKGFNPDYLIDAASQDPVAEVLNITDGIGADFVITANPVAKTHAQAVDMVRKRGTVILFGGLNKDNPTTSVDGNKIHYNEIKVVGSFSYNIVQNQKALDYIAGEIIKADKFINKIVPLDGIEEGIKAAERGEALKVVIDPWK